MKYLSIFLCLLLLSSCSTDKGNPLEILIDSKSSDELFRLSGEVMILDNCKPDVLPDSKCNSNLNTVISNLNKNGFDEINITHFQGAPFNRYLIKISLSENMLFKLNTRSPY
jgi:hypothetical protein